MWQNNAIGHGKQGFSLVELSIVIIIIGFLITGITTGTSLVKQAQLSSVMTDFQNYQAAYNNFLTRYDKAPGDFDGAENTWGLASISAGTTGAGNGDANGLIDSAKESLLAWKHLSLAKMISSGIFVLPATLPTPWVAGQHTPSSRISGAGYMMAYGGTSTGEVLNGAFGTTIYTWNDSITNVVFIGKPKTAAAFLPNGAIKAEDAYNLDKKLDDGQISGTTFIGANTGSIRTSDGNNATSPLCVAASGVYTVTTTTANCVVGFALN
jgi:prepilin-type N-terminal cleavage/methylation domain-containing protein